MDIQEEGMHLRKLLRDERGFSLTEMLVVIVIIGLLAALAIPKFLTVTTKAKTTEAKLMLKQVYNLQLSYYLENDVYADNLDVIGFDQEKLKTEGGNARYKIEMTESGPAKFLATATSVVDFDKDGTFNVWSVDQDGDIKEVMAD
jgi:type IV pilus assembly protein PilE